MNRDHGSCHALLTIHQSPGPFKFRINEPPSNVILDDRAVHEILRSDIPRAQLPKRWSHDFSGQASVRHRRAHRGRPAYKDEQATSENNKYHSFKPSGKNAPLYLFSGEKDYKPIFYHDVPDAPAESPEPEDDSPAKPKQHNQYTAPHLLVRNGAESASLTKGKYRPRVNTFLRRSPSPDWVKDRRKLFGGTGIGRTGANASANPAPASPFSFTFASAPALAGASSREESIWVDQDDENELEEKPDVEEEEEVLPSVFDSRPAADRTTGDGGNTRTHGASVTPSRRQASTSLFSARRKSPREMGYIERLAAGILQEDTEELEATTPREITHAAPSLDQDRIAQLQHELDAANRAIDERDGKIAQLESELEDAHMQMALQRSTEDD
jgi:hypothetical protein